MIVYFRNRTSAIDKFDIDKENTILFQQYQDKLLIDKLAKNTNNRLVQSNSNKLGKKNKIAIVSFDNRDEQYVTIHNQNFLNFCNKWNCEYIFFNQCEHNVYWCKMYFVLKLLESNSNYDFVMWWCDSDSVVKNMNFDLTKLLNSYNAHIYTSDDNANNIRATNAGLFVIRNSPIGRKFVQDCVQLYELRKPKCLQNNQLNGSWGGVCYEQGIMDEILLSKYLKFAVLIPTNIFFNNKECRNDVFIHHMYGSSNEERVNCFNEINQQK